MAEVKNYTGMKNATAVKAQVRIDVMEPIIQALREKFGEDSVAKVGTNEYAVVVGVINDKDGFPQEVVVTVKPTVKEWESRKTDKRTYTQFILADEAQAYEIETKEKEEKRAEEKAKREAKKERDKAQREKAKAEKEKENSAE